MAKLICADIAKELHISPRCVSAMIENGQLPIGIVCTDGKRRRTIIVPERWEAWRSGADIKGLAS